MTISQVSTLSTSPLTIPLPLHFPVFSSSLTDIHYKYTLWLYVASGCAKYWLIYALAKRKGIRRNAETVMLMLLAWVLLIIFYVQSI
jgi:hypothetical protein